MASNERLTDIFNDCINRLAQGESLAECLRAYPAEASLLRPMLEAGMRSRELLPPAVEVRAESAAVWQKITQTMDLAPVRPARRMPVSRILALAAMLALAVVTAAWFLFDRQQQQMLANMQATQTAEMALTQSVTATFTPTATPTVTPSATPTPTVTPSATFTPTVSPTVTLFLMQPPTPTPQPISAPMADNSGSGSSNSGSSGNSGSGSSGDDRPDDDSDDDSDDGPDDDGGDDD